MSEAAQIGSFAEFCPYYLREHRQLGTRVLSGRLQPELRRAGI